MLSDARHGRHNLPLIPLTQPMREFGRDRILAPFGFRSRDTIAYGHNRPPTVPLSVGRFIQIIPKEIPIAGDEVVHCECGREFKDRHSTRYFDYEKIE
jgi:hypothetical protein